MKKIKILSFASLPLAMALLAGCGHTHTFSEEWNHDANKHWHDATCEHKDQVSEEGDHVYGDDNICDVCGYDKGEEPGPGPGPTPHEHTFSDEWTHDDEKHWHAATCEHTDQKSGEAEHVYGDDNICDFCGYDKGEEPGPGPQPEIDHTVTAQEWAAFWDTDKPFYIADNYKATMVMTADGQSGSQTSVMTVDGNKAKFEGLINGVAAQLDYSEFISKGNYKHYEYDKTAEKWYYEVGSNNPADDFAMQLQPFFTMTGFTYDEASKSYKKESSGTYSNLVIQFGAKKVTSYSFNFLMPVGPGMTMPVKMEGTFDYNGQVVTLPENAEERHIHNYSVINSNDEIHWNECECGEKNSGSEAPHYDSDWDKKCDFCEHEMSVQVDPGYYIHYEIGYSSLYENPDHEGQLMIEEYLDADMQFTFYNVTSTDYNCFSQLTLSEDATTQESGVTLIGGVVTVCETAPYRFYLDPTYNDGKGILYVVKDDSPAPSESVYGYSYNNGEYESMIDCGKGAQWQLVDFYMNANETLKFADIVNPDMPNQITYLEDNGNLQGFTNVEGVLTAGADGYYVFTLNFDGDGNASITIGIGEEPTPVADVRLMGFGDWEGGMVMLPTEKGSLEYVATNLDVSKGDTVKVKFEGSWISDYKRNTGIANALDENLVEVDDKGNVQFNFSGVYNVYFNSEAGDQYGVFVERISVSCPFVGEVDYTLPGGGEGHDSASLVFNKVDLKENYIEFKLVNCPSGKNFIYTMNSDSVAVEFELENGGEYENFTLSGKSIVYNGEAKALNFYLKKNLSTGKLKLYVEEYKPAPTPTQKIILTLNPGVWDADGAKFAVYYWHDGQDDGVFSDFMVSDGTFYTIEVPKGYDKCIFVRLKDTCTTPNWGDKWNQTSDLNMPAFNATCVISDWEVGNWAE